MLRSRFVSSTDRDRNTVRIETTYNAQDHCQTAVRSQVNWCKIKFYNINQPDQDKGNLTSFERYFGGKCFSHGYFQCCSTSGCNFSWTSTGDSQDLSLASNTVLYSIFGVNFSYNHSYSIFGVNIIHNQSYSI